MEEKKTKRQETLEKALRTGQIGISKPTAMVLAELMKMEEAMERIADTFAEDIGGDAADRLTAEYAEQFVPLKDWIMKKWSEMVARNLGYFDCAEL